MIRFLWKGIISLGTLLLGVITFTNAVVVSISSPYIVDDTSELPEKIQFQTVIIPGAAVYSDGRLSSVTRGRMMNAIDLYNKGYVPTILISGDNGTEEYNEVRAMRNFAFKEGIDKSLIFQDFAGFDTYDTMYRGKAIFEVQTAAISTQEFHLYRAVYLARSLGIDARGVKAGGYQPRRRDRMMFREHLARVKAYGEVLFGSSPKFLGEPVPIDGESNGWVG